MARLNVEVDKIWRKAGFQKLMIQVGDRHKAKGIVIDLWELAQQYWFPERKLIPEQAFKEADLPDILFDPAIGLAERRPDGIYAKGSEEQFQWLFEAQEKGRKGGKASADKRKARNSKKKSDKLSTDEPKSTTAQAQVDPGSAQVNLAQPSLLSSLFSFLFSHYSKLLTLNSCVIPSELLSADPPIKLSPTDLFEFWNEVRETLPEAERLSKGRLTLAKAQLEKYPDPVHWAKAMVKIQKSEFCVTEWRPGFDVFLSEEKRLRAIEGKYDHRSSKPKKQAPVGGHQRTMDADQEYRELVGGAV